MGNGTSSQGGVPAYVKRDIRSSVEEEQHDWQPEQAVASRPETLSLQSTRKSYIIIIIIIISYYMEIGAVSLRHLGLATVGGIAAAAAVRCLATAISDYIMARMH